METADITDTPAALVIQNRERDVQGEQILDELETLVGVRGRRADDGRRYDLTASRDWVIAVTSMRAQLDAIAADWPDRLDFAIRP